MSVSRWAYIPDRCDGDACPGDCDLCSKAQDNIALIEEDNDVVDDLIRRADAIALASGGCHPANLAEELAKLPSAQRWIPVTESLPEENKWYLISNGLDSWVAIWSKENKEWLSVTGLDYTITDVIAWMEFPEAYEPPKEET